MDIRIQELAHNLVSYSCRVGKGDQVYINYIGRDTKELAKALVREVYDAGGIPYPHYEEPEIQREVLLHATKEQMELMAAADALQMGKMDCFIGVRGSDNVSELADVPAERMSLMRSIILRLCIIKYGYPRPAGWCSVIPIAPWRSFPVQAQKPLLISISASAIWITPRWPRR